MGMDINMYYAKSINMLEDQEHYPWQDYYELDEVRESPNFQGDYGTIAYPTDRPINVWYSRKFHNLMSNIPELAESYKDPYVIRIKKNTLKKMIEYYAFHEDYFGNFNGLPRLCELYRDYDDMQAQGLNLYLTNSY